MLATNYLLGLSYQLKCLLDPRHSGAHLTISFIETQRDIIANNQQYNNRFNYAVSSSFSLMSCFLVDICDLSFPEQLHQDFKVHPAYIPASQPLWTIPKSGKLLLLMPLHLAGGNIEIRLNSSKHDENNTIYAFSLKSAVWSTDCCEFQLIPEISSLSAVTTAVPLFSVLTLTAIKYGYDDIVSGAFYYKVINFIPWMQYQLFPLILHCSFLHCDFF